MPDPTDPRLVPPFAFMPLPDAAEAGALNDITLCRDRLRRHYAELSLCDNLRLTRAGSDQVITTTADLTSDLWIIARLLDRASQALAEQLTARREDRDDAA